MITHWRFPLGAQLIPILVKEPMLPNDQIWSCRFFPGIWFVGLTVWRKWGLP